MRYMCKRTCFYNPGAKYCEAGGIYDFEGDPGECFTPVDSGGQGGDSASDSGGGPSDPLTSGANPSDPLTSGTGASDSGGGMTGLAETGKKK
jgi:hypothetical protein